MSRNGIEKEMHNVDELKGGGSGRWRRAKNEKGIRKSDARLRREMKATKNKETGRVKRRPRTACENGREANNSWEARNMCLLVDLGFHDLFPLIQFSSVSSPRRIVQNRLFVLVTFPVVVNHGMHGSQLILSNSAPQLVLILKQITIVQWCERSSMNTTLTRFLSAEERFMFRMGMLLAGWLL